MSQSPELFPCACCGLNFKSPVFPVHCRCGTSQADIDAMPVFGEACHERRREPKPDGAGAYLKRFFDSLYLKPDKKCGCDELAAAMDANGPAWCERRLDDIVGHLKRNAAKYKLPFSEWLATTLVKRAITYARAKMVSV